MPNTRLVSTMLVIVEPEESSVEEEPTEIAIDGVTEKEEAGDMVVSLPSTEIANMVVMVVLFDL